MAALTTGREPVLKIYQNDKAVAQEACQFVIETAKQSIEERGSFIVGLSGGSFRNHNFTKDRNCSYPFISILLMLDSI